MKKTELEIFKKQRKKLNSPIKIKLNHKRLYPSKSVKALLTLQILDFLFSLYYDFKLSTLSRTSFKNFSSQGQLKRNMFLIYSNQEYYCHLFL